MHLLKDTRLTQGNSKVHRKLSYNFFTQEAPDTDTSDVPIWVQTGWDTSGNRLRDEAQAAGTDSPIVFLFIPRIEADAFKEALARREAASEVLNARPNDPTSGEAMEARKAMETRRDLAGAEVKRLVGTVLESARVYQGGGNEIVADSLPETVELAAENALVRLFPNFTAAADDSRWAAVLRRAIGGNGDSLTALGFNGDAAQHPVCKEVLVFVGSGGKRGGDVRKHFMGAGYGWPQDTVDGALLALLASNVMRATKNGQPVAVTAIPQNQIGVHDFEVEDVTVSTSQRIQIRSFLNEMGFGQVKSGEEVQRVLQMLRRMQEFAAEAGGEPPVSAKPDTETIDAHQALQGNALLAGIYESRDELRAFQAECKRRKNLIAERLPKWTLLLRLLDQAGDQSVARAVNVQVDAIRSERTLLAEPDPVTPLLAQLTDELRRAIRLAKMKVDRAREQEVGSLSQTPEWSALPDDVWEDILYEQGLGPFPEPDVSTDDALLRALTQRPLGVWDSEAAAMPTRLQKAREVAARKLDPEAIRVVTPSATLKNEAEVDAYLATLRADIMRYIDQDRPVIL